MCQNGLGMWVGGGVKYIEHKIYRFNQFYLYSSGSLSTFTFLSNEMYVFLWKKIIITFLCAYNEGHVT